MTQPLLEMLEVLAGKRRWAIVCADNKDVLPLIPDLGVDHCITDPPYSEGLYERYRTNAGNMATPGFGAQAAAMHARRIGSIDAILDETAAHVLRTSARWCLAFHDLEIGDRWRAAFGDRYVRTGIWVKPNPMPQISGDRPGVGYEVCTIAHAKGRKRWNGGGLPAVWTHNAENSQSSDRAVMGHPCPKPLSLMLELVELFTDPDELVLDPFAGSGTTGVACLRLGRRFIGIERDEKYAQIARERLAAESQGLSLRDARHGQQSLFGGST